MPELNIIQCKMCRKPFNSNGGKVCPSCMSEIEEAFSKIRDFIYDNPGDHNAKEIAEETDVPEKYIVHLMQEGRLISKTDSGISGLYCEVCKKPISEGKMCEDCKKCLASDLLGALPTASASPLDKSLPKGSSKSVGMHIRSDKKK